MLHLRRTGWLDGWPPFLQSFTPFPRLEHRLLFRMAFKWEQASHRSWNGLGKETISPLIASVLAFSALNWKLKQCDCVLLSNITSGFPWTGFHADVFLKVTSLSIDFYQNSACVSLCHLHWGIMGVISTAAPCSVYTDNVGSPPQSSSSTSSSTTSLFPLLCGVSVDDLSPPWRSYESIAGLTRRLTTIHTKIHICGQFRVAC